jgi:hypothetical protein
MEAFGFRQRSLGWLVDNKKKTVTFKSDRLLFICEVLNRFRRLR